MFYLTRFPNSPRVTGRSPQPLLYIIVLSFSEADTTRWKLLEAHELESSSCISGSLFMHDLLLIQKLKLSTSLFRSELLWTISVWSFPDHTQTYTHTRARTHARINARMNAHRDVWNRFTYILLHFVERRWLRKLAALSISKSIVVYM